MSGTRRGTMVWGWALAVVLAVGVTACEDEDGVSGPTSDVVDLAEASPDLETLAAAIGAAGLADALRGAGPYTVFAPTDAGFVGLPEGTLSALLASANADVLTELLLGHVVAGSYEASDLRDGQELVMLSGDRVTVSMEEGEVFIGRARVRSADVSASNGVVHVVDGVLTGGLDAVQRARVTPSLATLVSAVVEAELAETLSGAGPFTIFAPVETAFGALDAAALGRLLEDENRALLQKVLTYHVVPGRVLSTELVDGMTVATVEGSALAIGLDGGATVNGAAIVATDIEVENGVVHLIDGVLLDHLDVVDVAVLNGFTTLVGAVRAAGLESALRDPSASLTVFAPTEAAFGAIAPVPTDPAALQGLLLYHAVGATAYSTQLSDGQELTTLGGGVLTVQLDGGAVTLVGAENSAGVSLPDVAASNGVIHVIDAVLLPPSG